MMRTDLAHGKELQVRGKRLDINQLPKEETRKRYPLKDLHVEATSVDFTRRESFDNRRDFRSPFREEFRLKTARFPVDAVESDLLHAIRESVEIEDIRRLLRSSLGPGAEEFGNKRKNGGRGRPLRTVLDAGAIYREFFQDHYDLVRHAVEERTRQHQDVAAVVVDSE